MRFIFPPCSHCFGGRRFVRIIACDQPTSICGHFAHYEARRCRWCRGSNRCSIFYAAYRYLVALYIEKIPHVRQHA